MTSGFPNTNSACFYRRSFLAAVVLSQLLAPFFSGACFIANVSAQDVNSNRPIVDFKSEILPILEQKCYRCHSDEQADGDLRLDNEADALLGGHTGNQILGDQPDSSELFRRITSAEEGYRMPKEGDPLSKQEIDLFKDWIRQGSNWGETAPDGIKQVNEKTVTQRLADLWIQASNAIRLPRFRYAGLASIPLGLFLLGLLFSWRYKKRHPTTENRSTWRIWTNRFWIFAALSLAIFSSYQFGLAKELRNDNQKLQSQRPVIALQKPASIDPTQFTLPPHPMHPKRLGGVYYRGNDERSPKLFNGGFYRTAKLEVWLIDNAGNRFAWNDPLPESELFIQLLIERAPGTTRTLFSEEVLKTTHLRHFPQSKTPDSNLATEITAKKFPINEIVPDEKWESRIPIGIPSRWPDGFSEGMVYLFYGAMKIDGHQGRIHFGIKYDIRPVDKKISTDSEIWMGSLYNLNGRVFVPTKKIILLDRWFDFRPIPEISGENAVDPELLGIPEHVRQRRLP